MVSEARLGAEISGQNENIFLQGESAQFYGNFFSKRDFW